MSALAASITLIFLYLPPDPGREKYVTYHLQPGLPAERDRLEGGPVSPFFGIVALLFSFVLIVLPLLVPLLHLVVPVLHSFRARRPLR